MMTHRPALVSSSSCTASKIDEKDSVTLGSMQISIGMSIESAKEMTEIASNAIFQRVTRIRNDDSVADYIVSACMTLLYTVTSSSVTTMCARIFFSSVERGIYCLG